MDNLWFWGRSDLIPYLPPLGGQGGGGGGSRRLALARLHAECRQRLAADEQVPQPLGLKQRIAPCPNKGHSISLA